MKLSNNPSFGQIAAEEAAKEGLSLSQIIEDAREALREVLLRAKVLLEERKNLVSYRSKAFERSLAILNDPDQSSLIPECIQYRESDHSNDPPALVLQKAGTLAGVNFPIDPNLMDPKKEYALSTEQLKGLRLYGVLNNAVFWKWMQSQQAQVVEMVLQDEYHPGDIPDLQESYVQAQQYLRALKAEEAEI